MEAKLTPIPPIYPTPALYNHTNVPVERPPQDGPMDMYPRVEVEKKAEVAARRREKNNERGEKIRIIQRILGDLGESRGKKSSRLDILRRAALRLNVPLSQGPPVPHTGALDRMAEKALRERRSRSEATYVYKCLGQHLLGGSRNRDLILNEVMCALQRERTPFIGDTLDESNR